MGERIEQRGRIDEERKRIDEKRQNGGREEE